jgi:gamma-glutamylcysteine synthetase
MIDPIHKYFVDGFEKAKESRISGERRIGAELKFPLVKDSGKSADQDTVSSLWRFLQERDWDQVKDTMTGDVVGASKQGERNNTIASCETGVSKVEFSLAHVADLFELEKSIHDLRRQVRAFCEENWVYLLGYGIQPVTRPSKKLLFKKTRTSVWDKVFGANHFVPEKDGDDVCLFTVNAASHVHVDVAPDEAVMAINVLNGFSSAQVALTANSNIWLGRIDPRYKCVSEKLWDWWMPDSNRVGVPRRPFKDLQDYARTVSELPPVYVKRLGRPIILRNYTSFKDYYYTGRAVGTDPEDRDVSLVPVPEDIDLHNTCYWYNARLSRHFTVENRANDQQPPDDLICIAALTLGLLSSLGESWEVVRTYDWEGLRNARESACRLGLEGVVANQTLTEFASKMVELADEGLKKRGIGEEVFLNPLKERLDRQTCPADDAAEMFEAGGVESLIAKRRI